MGAQELKAIGLFDDVELRKKRKGNVLHNIKWEGKLGLRN